MLRSGGEFSLLPAYKRCSTSLFPQHIALSSSADILEHTTKVDDPLYTWHGDCKKPVGRGKKGRTKNEQLTSSLSWWTFPQFNDIALFVFRYMQCTGVFLSVPCITVCTRILVGVAPSAVSEGFAGASEVQRCNPLCTPHPHTYSARKGCSVPTPTPTLSHSHSRTPTHMRCFLCCTSLFLCLRSAAASNLSIHPHDEV